MAKGRKTGGRKPGSPNRVTVAVKEALQQTFSELGGVESLKAWAQENPTAFYNLWGKLIPTEVKAVHEGDMIFTIATGVPRRDE